MSSTTLARVGLGMSKRGLCVAQRARLYSKEPDGQLQGYPELPPVSRQWLPPTGWDDVQHRRNFGDTIHEEGELYGMWGPDIPTTEPKVALRHFLMAFSSFGVLGGLLYLFPPKKHYVPRTQALEPNEYDATMTISGETHH